MNGVLCYATTLLRKKDFPCFQAPKEAVLPSLWSLERRLAKDPDKAASYNAEVKTLVTADAMTKLPSETKPTGESWYIHHFTTTYNGKD